MPPLKFRAAGFPQHGFKYGFGYDLRHWSHRLNLPWYSLRSLCLIHILRLSSCLLLIFCPFQALANQNRLSLQITTHHPEALRSDRVMLSLSSSLLLPHPPVCIALFDFSSRLYEKTLSFKDYPDRNTDLPYFDCQTLYDCHLLCTESSEYCSSHLLHIQF